MTRADTLNPCPGCGMTDWLFTSVRIMKRSVLAEVVCGSDDGCGWRGPAIRASNSEAAKKSAKLAWNMREPATAVGDSTSDPEPCRLHRIFVCENGHRLRDHPLLPPPDKCRCPNCGSTNLTPEPTP